MRINGAIIAISLLLLPCLAMAADMSKQQTADEFLNGPPSAQSVLSNDYPTDGTVNSVTPGDVGDLLNYKCALQTDALHCHFDQTLIMQKSSPDKLTKRLSYVPEMLKTIKDDPSQCPMDFIKQAIEGMETGQSSKLYTQAMLEDFKARPDPEKKDIIRMFKDHNKLCQEPNKDNAISMIQHQEDVSARTCNIVHYEFDEVFHKQDPGLWVSNKGPDGNCSVIQISKFERDDKAGGSLFWNYSSQQVMMNENAPGPLLSCKQLKESGGLQEMVYQWPIKSVYFGCDYIEH